jgi:hypothetical protein
MWSTCEVLNDYEDFWKLRHYFKESYNEFQNLNKFLSFKISHFNISFS